MRDDAHCGLAIFVVFLDRLKNDVIWLSLLMLNEGWSCSLVWNTTGVSAPAISAGSTYFLYSPSPIFHHQYNFTCSVLMHTGGLEEADQLQFSCISALRCSPLKLEKILDNKDKLSDVCQHNNRGGHGAVERFGGGNSGKRGSFGENQGAVKVPRTCWSESCRKNRALLTQLAGPMSTSR